jgi:hypothetical protein
MATITENLERIQQAKADIKAAIQAKGVTVSDELISQYANLIAQIPLPDREADMPKPLPATIVTLGGVNVSTNDHIKIYGSDKNSYTCEEWYALEGKGTTILPIGLDINAWGLHFVWYFKCKYRDATDNNKTYYDVSGTASHNSGNLRHSQWQHPVVTGAYTKTDLNNTVATATVDGDDLVLSTTNSPKTWRMKKSMGNIDAFKSESNYDERYNSFVAQTEWFRHRAAIDSGLTTEEADGTEGVVTIVTEQDNEMYFYVNGSKTNCLAKYNIHSMMGGGNPTQAIIDAIYAAQKTNGTNMNATCLDGHAKPVVTDGSKGAEAYAFNGKWMIVTPILTRCNTNLTMDYNIPDAPAVYYVKYLGSLYNETITLPCEQMLECYWLNKGTVINSMISFLNNAVGGSCNIGEAINTYMWTPSRLNSTQIWYIMVSSGNCAYANVFSFYTAVGVSKIED